MSTATGWNLFIGSSERLLLWSSLVTISKANRRVNPLGMPSRVEACEGDVGAVECLLIFENRRVG